MTAGLRWGLTLVAAVLVGLALVALYAGLLTMTGGLGWTARWGGYRSNGERIYFSATSNSGQPIVADMGSMTMSTPMTACADCHGVDGRGGRVRMMMGWFEAPDIRYHTLTAAEHAEEHPPYTDELIRRAITEGLDPAGEPLAFPMPRWRMSAADLDDLLGYLKSLE
jgi:cytochrome c oxidase subunit II